MSALLRAADRLRPSLALPLALASLRAARACAPQAAATASLHVRCFSAASEIPHTDAQTNPPPHVAFAEAALAASLHTQARTQESDPASRAIATPPMPPAADPSPAPDTGLPSPPAHAAGAAAPRGKRRKRGGVQNRRNAERVKLLAQQPADAPQEGEHRHSPAGAAAETAAHVPLAETQAPTGAEKHEGKPYQAPATSSSAAPPTLPSLYSLPPLSPAVRELLRGYSHPIPVHVAWGEQDTFAHVNNARYITWAESARIHWLASLADVRLSYNTRQALGIHGGPEKAAQALKAAIHSFLSGRGSAGPILKSVFFQYKSAVTYPDLVVVASRLAPLQSPIGLDRFWLTHRLVSVSQGTVVGECEGCLVCVDYEKKGRSTPLPPIIEAALRQRMREQERVDASLGTVVKPPKPTVSFKHWEARQKEASDVSQQPKSAPSGADSSPSAAASAAAPLPTDPEALARFPIRLRTDLSWLQKLELHKHRKAQSPSSAAAAGPSGMPDGAAPVELSRRQATRLRKERARQMQEVKKQTEQRSQSSASEHKESSKHAEEAAGTQADTTPTDAPVTAAEPAAQETASRTLDAPPTPADAPETKAEADLQSIAAPSPAAAGTAAAAAEGAPVVASSAPSSAPEASQQNPRAMLDNAWAEWQAAAKETR